jgi:hypothetical protein
VYSITLGFRSKILLIIILEIFTRSSNSRYMIMYSICGRLLNIMDSQETAYRTYRESVIYFREDDSRKRQNISSFSNSSFKSISVGGSPALCVVSCFQFPVLAWHIFFVNLAGLTKIEC